MQQTNVNEHRIEDLLYYLNLMQLRRFTGSFVIWLYDGKIQRSTLQKLRQQLRLSGIPFEPTEEEREYAKEEN